MTSEAEYDISALTQEESGTGSGKLSDRAIGRLCGGQFHIVQWQTVVEGYPNGLFCYFLTGSDGYSDGSNALAKWCGPVYSPSANYKTLKSDSSDYWGFGFGSWRGRGSIIPQLHYGDSREGSIIAHSAVSSGEECSGEGGCHTSIYCLPAGEGLSYM